MFDVFLVYWFISFGLFLLFLRLTQRVCVSLTVRSIHYFDTFNINMPYCYLILLKWAHWLALINFGWLKLHQIIWTWRSQIECLIRSYGLSIGVAHILVLWVVQEETIGATLCLWWCYLRWDLIFIHDDWRIIWNACKLRWQVIFREQSRVSCCLRSWDRTSILSKIISALLLKHGGNRNRMRSKI